MALPGAERAGSAAAAGRASACSARRWCWPLGAARRRAPQGGRDARPRPRDPGAALPGRRPAAPIWRLVDREVEQRWLRLPPLPKALVRSHAQPARRRPDRRVTGGGELAAESARLAGQQLVDALCARLMGDVLGGAAHATTTTPSPTRSGSPRISPPSRWPTGMRRDDAEILAQAGLLHDIGKAAVPVGILDKPGPARQRRMAAGPAPPADRRRGAASARRRCRPIWSASPSATTSGWTAPATRTASAGAEIDEPSLLCAIADVHTALTDRRAYRSPLATRPRRSRACARWPAAQLEPGLFARYEAVMLDARPTAPRRWILTDHLDPVAGRSVAAAIQPVEQHEQAARVRARPASAGRRCRPCRRPAPARSRTRNGTMAAASAADRRAEAAQARARTRRRRSRSRPPPVGEDEAVDPAVRPRDHREHRLRRAAADRDLAEADRGRAGRPARWPAGPAAAGW